VQLTHPVAELVFLFSFFLTNTATGVYFVYASKFPKRVKAPSQVVSFEAFLQQYEITPRESEVIMEIYKGKTNQEIADTLFVTIQTIKDHTHRIYLKTQVKNRTQLASLLRKFER
jgi:DNA-binding NarL/FixJ family response regulator